MEQQQIRTNTMMKMKGRLGMAYFIADPYCGGVNLYELYLTLISHPEIYALYEKKYGEETEKRIREIRKMNKQNLQLAMINRQLEKLYRKFTSLGDTDSRSDKLNEVIKRLTKQIWAIAGKMEPLHYMLCVDTIWLLHHTDVGNQTLAQAHLSMARNEALNYRTDSVIR